MIGRLNMVVESGTIMGPNTTGEFITAMVCGNEMNATLFRWTQTKDFNGVPATGPRSVTEHKMMTVQQSIFGPIRCDPIEYNHPQDIGKIYDGEVMPAKLIRPEPEEIRLKQGRGMNDH